jgi:hypothetical protein
MNLSKYIGGLGKALALSCVLFTASSCEIDAVLDPNNPSLAGVTENATRSEIQNLVDGIQGGMRIRLGTYYDGVGVIGREYYRFSASDPRFTSDLLGKGEAILDNNTFYTTGPFAARYRTIRNCLILVAAAENTTNLTAEEVEATVGFAQTIMAHEYLLVLNQMGANGIRFDVDTDGSPFLSESESLSAIAGLLDEGATALTNAGADFPFGLTSGFASTSDPVTFRQFNRALAARVALYAGDDAGALSALDDSFYDIAGDLNTGVYLPYSSAGGDELNPMWFPLNATGETRVAHPSFVTDADPADARLSKATARTEAAFQDDLTSDYDVTVYAANTDPISVLRNEELILINAEANARSGNSGPAVTAIDAIRAAHGLGAYAGGTDEASLIDEILVQRRYSLYGEGHRWVDMRRYGRLGDLPIDRTGDDVWESFPIPATENQ